MIKVLFLGGFRHKQINTVASDVAGYPAMANIRFPLMADDKYRSYGSDHATTSEITYETYILKDYVTGKSSMVFVYVLLGIADSSLHIYMQEPGMKEQISKLTTQRI